MNKKSAHTASTSKPRIMFCTSRWLTGGMERKMSNLFNGLVDYYEVYLFTIGKPDSVIEIPPTINILTMAEAEFPANYSKIALQKVRHYKIDIIIGVVNLLDAQLDLYEACAKAGVKTISANSENFFYPYQDKNLYCVKKRQLEVFNRLDVVLWQTNFSAAAYGRSGNNGYVMPNPNTYQKQKILASKKDSVIICVGRFNDYIKRVDRILECFSLVLKREPEAKLWLVGPCDRGARIARLNNKSINDMIAEFGIDEMSINFFGQVDDMGYYYLRASVLLLTSENEGFPNVVNEAACFGLPIVYSKIPGLSDIVKHEYNGFASEQDDVVDLSNNVCRLLSDPVLRKELGLNAAEFANNFDIAKIIAKWRLIIDNLVISSNRSVLREKLNSELDFKVDKEGGLYLDLLAETEVALDRLNSEYCLVSMQLSDSDIKASKFDEANNRLIRLTAEYNLLIRKHLEITNSKAWWLIEKYRYAKSFLNRYRRK